MNVKSRNYHFGLNRLFMNLSISSTHLPNTIFVVGRYAGGSSKQRILSSPGRNWLLGLWNNGIDCGYFEGWINSCQTADFNWKIYASSQMSGQHKMYAFTQLIGTTTAGFQGPIGLSLGGAVTSELSSSDVAELIVYDRVLTDSEREQVLFYLNLRYGIYN